MDELIKKESLNSKIKHNKIEFDIRDGLSTTQRIILQMIRYLCDEDYDGWHYEEGFSAEQILKEIKTNRLNKMVSPEKFNAEIEKLCNFKYPLLAINEKNEICIRRVFDKMFEGQDGTDYCSDFVLSSLFPNFLCNGGIGYSSHDIKDVVEAVEAFVKNRNISDSEIHEILKDETDKDLKKLVEEFVNHRINVLGRLNRIKYDMFDKSVRILKYGTEKQKQRIQFDIDYYENLKNEQIEAYGKINDQLIAEQRELLGKDALSHVET